MSKIRLCCSAILAVAALAIAHPAPAQSGKLLVELNKLEESEANGCRSFFLFRNGSGLTFEAFEMSLAVLATDGVIDRLLTIDAAPLPADRTALRLFDIPEIGCSKISEFILHDIPVCKPQNADETDCFLFIELNSRAGAALVR